MRAIDADALNSIKFHPLPYTHITPSDADAESYKRGWNDAIDSIIENAPTIESERQWIPCKDGEPEEYGEYRITWTTSVSKKRFIGDAEYEVSGE